MDSQTENQEEIPKKRQKVSILDNFSKLKYEQLKVRVKNGATIVKQLKNAEDDEKGRDELNRTLVRLIRGLGSPLLNARAGYFSTLVALLKAHDVAFEQLYEVFTKQLSSGGSNSKSENADVYCGQILLWGAVIRAGRYIELSHENKMRLLELLVQAGKKRSYLSLMSTMFILDLVNQADEKSFASTLWPALKEEVDKPWPEQNLDGAFLIVSIYSRFTKLFKNKLKAVCNPHNLSSDDNLEALCRLLIDVPLLITVKHPIYKIIPEILVQLDLVKKFVLKADEHLAKPNRNRLIAMAILLKTIAGNANYKSTVSDLLSKNFIKQTWQTFQANQQKQKDEEFETLIHSLFASIVDALKKPEMKWQMKIDIIEKLLFEPGTFTFEKITKSKVIQQIVNTLCVDGVKKMAEIYKGVVLKTIGDGKTNEVLVNNNRIYAAQLLAKLLNHPSTHSDLEWKKDQLLFLLKLGLTKNDGVGTELASSIKQTFFGALNLKYVKLNSVCNVLSGLFHEVDSIIKNSPSTIRDNLSDDVDEVWRNSFKLLQKLEGKTKKSNVNTVFRFLFLQMSLQIFNDAKLAVDSLKELFTCYEKSRSSSKIDLAEGDPLWIEVVIELFLNLLSHKSQLLRSVVGYVFPHLCEYVDESAMNQILSVLDVKNNPLSNTDKSSDDDSDGDKSDSEDSDDNDDVDEDIEDADETVNDKLRMAVRQALGGYQTDEESVDIDDMSDSEAKRLDTALAEAFKQYKPNKGKNTKKQSKEDETLTHFRVRTLDLIDIYLDNDPKMSLCLQTIVPLLEALEFSIRDHHQRPLQDRISACLRKMSNLKNVKADDVNATILRDLLKSLLEKGNKGSLIIQDMGDKIAECCIFILRCAHILLTSEDTPKKQKKKIEGVYEVVSDEIESHFKKRESLTLYVMLKTILPLNWTKNVDFVPLLFGYVFAEEVKQFRKNQALELLRIFYKNHRILSNNEISSSLCDCERNFASNTLKFFNENTVKVPEKFVCSLLNLLILIKQSPKENVSIDWNVIGDCVKYYRSKMSLAKDTKQAYNRLCNLIGISSKVELKIDESNKNKSEKETNVKSTTRRKPKGKVLKLKKESQMLRLKSSSEGLEDVFFTTDLGRIKDDEMEAQDETDRGEKRPKDGGGKKRKKVKKE